MKKLNMKHVLGAYLISGGGLADLRGGGGGICPACPPRLRACAPPIRG